MEQSKPQFCRLCYGYTKDADNQIVVDKPQADVVRTLYQEYVKGASLATLVELLVRRNYSLPNRKRALDTRGHRQPAFQYQIRSTHHFTTDIPTDTERESPPLQSRDWRRRNEAEGHPVPFPEWIEWPFGLCGMWRQLSQNHAKLGRDCLVLCKPCRAREGNLPKFPIHPGIECN